MQIRHDVLCTSAELEKLVQNVPLKSTDCMTAWITDSSLRKCSWFVHRSKLKLGAKSGSIMYTLRKHNLLNCRGRPCQRHIGPTNTYQPTGAKVINSVIDLPYCSFKSARTYFSCRSNRLYLSHEVERLTVYYASSATCYMCRQGE